jgi:serine/threonine protein phosphatase 1
MKGRKLVLGDIHGELDMLRSVFELSQFHFQYDQLIQIGDICDRGPSSYEVVEFLKQCKNLILIEGNHDQWLKEYIRTNMRTIDDMWMEQGAKATMQSYSKQHLKPDVHEAFYAQQIPYYVDAENNCFVHGGFDLDEKIAVQDMEGLAWNRELVNDMMLCPPGHTFKNADHFKHIYIGHTPTIYWGESKPVTRGGITNIDTGCGKGGKLTIMDVETGEFWQSAG